jgi:hypothetical protein
MSMRNWQEEGVRLAGALVDAVEIIPQALPLIRPRKDRKEIERFLVRRGGPLPSQEALQSLEAALIAASMMQPKAKRGYSRSSGASSGGGFSTSSSSKVS